LRTILALLLVAMATAAQAKQFDVSKYATPAAAFAAATAAGGGEVYFPYHNAHYVLPPTTVTNNITVTCDNTQTLLEAQDSTSNVLVITGYSVTVRNCGFVAAGWSYANPTAQQISGAFIDVQGYYGTIDNVFFQGGYYDIWREASAQGHFFVSHVASYGKTYSTTSPGAAVLRCDGSPAEMSHFLLGASGAPMSGWPSYGVLNFGCALDLSDGEILNTIEAVRTAPSVEAGTNMTNLWLDTNVTPVTICPAGGVVDQVLISNSWIGADAGNGILADTTGTYCGTGSIKVIGVSNSQLFNYTNGQGNGIFLGGAGILSVNISNNTIHAPGMDFWVGVYALGTANVSVTGNYVVGTAGKIILGSGGVNANNR
jgi:hypothetical protein